MNSRLLAAALAGLVTFTAAPAFADLSDADLEAAIKHKFINEPGIPLTVLIDVDDGVAKLRGPVANEFFRARATEVAQSVEGVRMVVDYTSLDQYFRDDESIRNDLERGFAMNRAVESYEIDAVVDSGEVSLAGTVDSEIERRAAERVAWMIPGVKKVSNALIVAATEQRSDQEIEDDIQEELAWNVGVDEELIFVNVLEGEAQLLGHVGTEQELTVLSGILADAGNPTVKMEVEIAPFAQAPPIQGKVVPIGAAVASTSPKANSDANEATAPNVATKGDKAQAALLPVE